jgi:hypothetical protein
VLNVFAVGASGVRDLPWLTNADGDEHSPPDPLEDLPHSLVR